VIERNECEYEVMIIGMRYMTGMEWTLGNDENFING